MEEEQQEDKNKNIRPWKQPRGQKRPCHEIYGKYSIQKDFGPIVKGKTFGKQ